jgi:hypothetical protein
MTISPARAKKLCNASELELVKASGRSEIGKLSAARLKQKVTRARKLRDKWRDQATRQRRATQSRQQARGTDDNARSAEKADLFDEVLNRFSSQLEKIEADGGGKVGPRRQTPRKSRTVEHRETRAATRKSLEETRQELDSKPASRKPASKKSGAKSTSRKSTSRKSTGQKSEGTKAVARKSASKKVAGKKATRKAAVKNAEPAPSSDDAQPSENSPPEVARRSSSTSRPQSKRRKTAARETLTRSLEGGSKAQGLKVTRKSQLKSSTAAKKNRVKTGGHIRTQKHLSATNKRRQARRDSR